MLECPHRCMHDQFCIKSLNHHCCTCVMEIMWDIPLSLNRRPNQHPNIYHVQPFYKLWAKNPTRPKPWPGMRISILALRRKQKEKRKFPTKDRKKTKRKYTERSSDQATSEQNITVTSKQEKKGNHNLKWSSPFDYQPKSHALATFSFRTKQKQKGKGQNTQSQISHQKHYSQKVLLIRDHMCNLWFDRKWLANSSHDISMVWN